MNKTKRGLIITAIVLNFISIALNLYFAILYFLPPTDAITILLGVYQILGVGAYIAANCLLIYAIADGGKHFRQRNGLYMTAVVLTFVLNLFSVSSILLLITLFMSDWVWVKPKDDDFVVVEEKKTDNMDEKEKKIAQLRKLKEEGKITEEEFNEQLFKLL